MRVRDEKSGKAQLSLALVLKTQGTHKETLPLLLTRDGANSQVDVPLNAAMERQNLKFDLTKIESGWGKVRTAGGRESRRQHRLFRLRASGAAARGNHRGRPGRQATPTRCRTG